MQISNDWADKEEVQREYNLALINSAELENNQYKTIVLAVAHDTYRALKRDNKQQVIYDIKYYSPIVMEDSKR